MAPSSPRNAESGLTLIEILVAVVILTICSLSVVGAIGTLASSSGLNRLQADVGAVIRSAAEQIKAEPYVPCNLFSSSNFYGVTSVALPELNVQPPVILQVQALSQSGSGQPQPVYSGGPPTPCNPASQETGLQLIEISDSSVPSAANVSEHQWVVKSVTTDTSIMSEYPLLTLAAGSTSLSVLLGGTLSVAGDLDVTSNSAGSVTVPTGANLTTASASSAYYSNGGSATCAGAGCPSLPWNSPTPSNPFASAAPPSTPSTAGGCTTSGSTTTCTPGYYSGAAAITNPSSLVFTSGVYVLNNTQLNLTGGGTVTNTQGGVFFYLVGGSTATFGQNVALSAIGQGSWQNLLLWQTGSTMVTIAGGSNPTSLQGIIYAPSAATTLSGGSGGVTVGSLIASSVLVGAGGIVWMGL